MCKCEYYDKCCLLLHICLLHSDWNDSEQYYVPLRIILSAILLCINIMNIFFAVGNQNPRLRYPISKLTGYCFFCLMLDCIYDSLTAAVLKQNWNKQC